MPCCNRKKIIRGPRKRYDKYGIILHKDEDGSVEPLSGKDVLNALDPKKNGLEKALDPQQNGVAKALDPQQNGVAKAVDTAVDTVKDSFKELENKTNEIGDTITNKFNEIKDKATAKFNEFKDQAESKLKDFGNKVDDAFGGIFKRIKEFGEGLKGIFDGIRDMFKGMFEGIGDGFNDIGTLFRYFGLFLQSNLFCGVKFIRNFLYCFKYYIIEAFLRSIYLVLFGIPFWIARRVFQMDMQYLEDLLWKYLWQLDGYIYSATKQHILMWPVNVRNDCYNCVRMKVSAMERIANEIDQDFRVGIKRKMTYGIDEIKSSADKIKHAFS